VRVATDVPNRWHWAASEAVLAERMGPVPLSEGLRQRWVRPYQQMEAAVVSEAEGAQAGGGDESLANAGRAERPDDKRVNGGGAAGAEPGSGGSDQSLDRRRQPGDAGSAPICSTPGGTIGRATQKRERRSLDICQPFSLAINGAG
jgi:hypothetical protein